MEYLYSNFPHPSLASAEAQMSEIREAAKAGQIADYAGGRVWEATVELPPRVTLFFRVPANFDRSKWPKGLLKMEIRESERDFYGLER